MLCNLSGNSYIKFFVLDFKFRFSCRELILDKKNSSWQIYYVTASQKGFHIQFTLFILIWICRKIPFLTKHFSWSVSNINLWPTADKQNLRTEICNTWNYLATCLVNNFMRSLAKSLRLIKMLTYWGLKETGTSYDQIFSFPDNQWKNLLQKVKKTHLNWLNWPLIVWFFFFSFAFYFLNNIQVFGKRLCDFFFVYFEPKKSSAK